MATPTPTPAGPPLLVWVVKAGGGSWKVRAMSPSGSSPHDVVTVPGDAQFLAYAAGKVAFLYADKTLHVMSFSGTAVTVASGAGPSDSVFGGAFSPDGTRLAFSTATTSSGALRVLTLATSAVAILHTYSSNTVDAPIGWTSSRIYAVTVVGFSDAGTQAYVALDPATGTETSSTSTAGAAGSAFSSDGVHGADSIHSMLGDEGDSPGGPGPQQPFNTLRTFTIGSTPANAYTPSPHHQISVFAVSSDGGTVAYYNDSSAGGFAGISMSPDFGLFFLHAGTPMQLTHYGDVGHWNTGAFIDSTSAAMAVHVGSDEQLVLVGPGHTPPAMIDSLSGGDAVAFVGYSPTS